MSRLLIGGLAILTAGVAAFGAASVVIRADGESKRSTKRIITMPRTEFARLEQGFETFESMSTEEQARLREIHRLLQDPNAGSRLGVIGRNYYQWYKSLGLSSKAKLNGEQDPHKKLALVQKMIKEQDEERQRRESNQNDWMRRWRRRLTSDDLAAVFAVIEAKLNEDGRFNKELGALEELQGVWRYNEVMKLVRQKVRLRHELGPQSLRLLREFFDDERFLEAIADEKMRERLQDSPSNQQDSQERRGRDRRVSRFPPPVIYIIIIGSMIEEYDRVVESDKPTDDELEDYFENELNGVEQDKLLSEHANDLIDRLEEDFMRAHPKRYPENPRRLFMPRNSWGSKRGRRSGSDRYRSRNSIDRPARKSQTDD